MHKKFEIVSIWICLAVGVWSIWLHFFSPLDTVWQEFFYVDGRWLVDENEPVLKWLLYRIPKIVCGVVGFIAMVLIVLDWAKYLTISPDRKLGLWTFIVTIIFYPTLVALFKDLIRQPCPRDIMHFGGSYAGTMWDYFLARGQVRCFPGAHASAPFSFLALAYIFRDPANRGLFLFSILPIAFFIGFYQVAKGAHFVSDTICTAAFAWVFIACFHRTLRHFKKL